jgi:hypothetical protein
MIWPPVHSNGNATYWYQYVFHQPPGVGSEHTDKGERHDIRPCAAPRLARHWIEQQHKTERCGERKCSIFRPERSRQKRSGESPVGNVPAAYRPVEEQSGERPERKLHLIMGKLHHRKVVIVHTFKDQNRAQCAKRPDDFATQQPDAVETEHGSERSQHINGLNVPGEAINEVCNPPRQWRVLPVTELPFFPERQVLGQIELQVGTDQDRNKCPHREVNAEDHRQHGARGAAGIRNRRRKAPRGRLRDATHFDSIAAIVGN